MNERPLSSTLIRSHERMMSPGWAPIALRSALMLSSSTMELTDYVALADMEITVHQDREITSRTLLPGLQYIAAMNEYFGINLDARYEDLSPLGPIRL